MINDKEILKKLDDKYHDKFEYKYENSHNAYLNGEMIFSVNNADMMNVSPPFDINCSWRQVEILYATVFPASLKYKSEDLDDYEKKCLFTLAFVYMLGKVFPKEGLTNG